MPSRPAGPATAPSTFDPSPRIENARNSRNENGPQSGLVWTTSTVLQEVLCLVCSLTGKNSRALLSRILPFKHVVPGLLLHFSEPLNPCFTILTGTFRRPFQTSNHRSNHSTM